MFPSLEQERRLQQYVASKLPCTPVVEGIWRVRSCSKLLEQFPVNTIADGRPKDPNLVVKCALTCSHEQADNEHSLTVSKRLVTTERAAFSHELIHDRKNDQDCCSQLCWRIVCSHRYRFAQILPACLLRNHGTKRRGKENLKEGKGKREQQEQLRKSKVQYLLERRTEEVRQGAGGN